MSHTITEAPCRLGRPITLDFHQVWIGDVILWNDRWFVIVGVHRTPEAKNPINQVKLDIMALPSEGFTSGSIATGEECSKLTVIPKAWVDRSRLPQTTSA